jgi:hypothetical protein
MVPFLTLMWKNITEPGGSQMTIWRKSISCWITKTTDTHSEYVIRIDFPLQQWLNERASLLHYTYTACIVVHWYRIFDQDGSVEAKPSFIFAVRVTGLRAQWWLRRREHGETWVRYRSTGPAKREVVRKRLFSGTLHLPCRQISAWMWRWDEVWQQVGGGMRCRTEVRHVVGKGGSVKLRRYAPTRKC